MDENRRNFIKKDYVIFKPPLFPGKLFKEKQALAELEEDATF